MGIQPEKSWIRHEKRQFSSQELWISFESLFCHAQNMVDLADLTKAYKRRGFSQSCRQNGVESTNFSNGVIGPTRLAPSQP